MLLILLCKLSLHFILQPSSAVQSIKKKDFNGSVDQGCKIHRLHLCRGVRPPTTTNECPKYDTTQSDDEALVMLKLLGMQSTPLLPSLPAPLYSDKVLSRDHIELNCVHMLNWIVGNRTDLTFNCVQANDWCLIEFLVIHSNSWETI